MLEIPYITWALVFLFHQCKEVCMAKNNYNKHGFLKNESFTAF